MGRNYPGWEGFERATWTNEINVRSFIRHNYTPYDGDDSFLAGPTQDTLDLWDQVMDLTKQEREAGGVLDMDTKIISTITSHGPGYLNKDKEKIVGFQTDKPFKRALMPYGGIRMAEKACADNGYEVDPQISEFFSIHRKTHNAGVFDAYTPEMRACRSSHIITGLPDAYGRGRIIGDYRRVALYGVDRLIEDKMEQKETTRSAMYSQVIRAREELSEQIRALQDLKKMALSYGYDISKPARDTKEAIQWLYFGYLAAVKEQNGAAMSLGRTSKFPKDSIAFKWADEMAETILREIEWSTSRTGLMNPVAIFDPVELEGSTVSRASVHNVSILKELKLSIGDKIKVYKANMIIPQIAENLTGEVSTAEIPAKCFVCGGETEVRKLRDGEALYCTNPNCSAQRIQALSHFVSRDAMNMEGLSEETLKKFLEKGFVENYPDIFRLEEHKDEIISSLFEFFKHNFPPFSGIFIPFFNIMIIIHFLI